MNENQSFSIAQPRTERGNPLFSILRYVTRVVTTLAIGILLGILNCAWHLAFFLLCMLRPVVNVLMLGGVIMPLVAFVAFVKPEAANGMPFWIFLLMAIGFVCFAMGYSKFVDRFAPPGTENPAARYQRHDWH